MLAGYGPNLKDKILFLEGTGDVVPLDRQLTSLKLNGIFKEIKGLIIGWFKGSETRDKEKNRSVSELILEATKEYSFPILELGELGHNVENHIFPIGCKASIDVDKKISLLTRQLFYEISSFE